MSIPALDLSSIFWSAVADFVLSTMIFLIFRIRKVTLIFNVVISFVIPYLSIMFFINSKPPVEQAVPVIGNYIVSSLVNLLVFTLSLGISYIIGSIAYQVSGGRTEEPEF
jgi:hypothetical protein